MGTTKGTVDLTRTRPVLPAIGLNHVSYAVFAVGAVVWGLLAPSFWVFTTTVAVLLAISTLGLTVVVGWAREVSLVQAGLTGTAVYLGGYAYRPNGGWGWPFVAAALAAIAVVVAMSLLLSLATARLSGIYIMVLTLALQLTIERTIFSNHKLTGGVSGTNTPRPELGISFTNDRMFYLLCLSVLGLSVFALARLRSSRHGQALLLVGTDRQAAASVGISPWRYKMFAFAVAGFFAGVAGVFIGPLFGTPPEAAVTFFALNTLFYLAIPVLAGFQSLFGVILVAIGFGVAPQALEPLHISPLVLGGVGLLGGTLAGRSGISGLVSDQLRNLRRRRAAAGSPGDGSDADLDFREPAVYAMASGGAAAVPGTGEER